MRLVKLISINCLILFFQLLLSVEIFILSLWLGLKIKYFFNKLTIFDD